MSAADDFVEFAEAVGPKRVDTKEIEIEAHSPLVLQKLRERIGPKPVTLNQFPLTKVIPKYGSCICETNHDIEYDC